MRLEYAMPRRKKEPWDTPEIQALGAGFARQGYFRKGYGEARGEANAFAINATAVVGKVKPQIAFLTAIHGNYGAAGGKFLQPISIPKVISATGIKNTYYVNQAFDAGRTGLGREKGYEHSSISGPDSSMELFRAHRTS